MVNDTGNPERRSAVREAHSAFGLYLLFLGIISLVTLGAYGWSYYLTPLDLRPFHRDYASLKPSGTFGHGLGIIGSLMIIVGVAAYSGRKRIRSLRNAGRVSGWLQFHIFLCLLGPILVVYHTTFKAGGVAAITLWCMLAVVGSGVIGRFLYALIPRASDGSELDADQIGRSMSDTGTSLRSLPEGAALLREIDEALAAVPRPTSFMTGISAYLRIRTIRKSIRSRIEGVLDRAHIAGSDANHIRRITSNRAALIQKSLVLNQTQRLFYYWHIIHLPFTIIMFITLVLHVVVVILLGYRWIL
jgi:hypothetical protein